MSPRDLLMPLSLKLVRSAPLLVLLVPLAGCGGSDDDAGMGAGSSSSTASPLPDRVGADPWSPDRAY